MCLAGSERVLLRAFCHSSSLRVRKHEQHLYGLCCCAQSSVSSTAGVIALPLMSLLVLSALSNKPPFCFYCLFQQCW